MTSETAPSDTAPIDPPTPAATPAAAPPRKATGAGAAQRIQNLWHRLSRLPGGKRVFSWLIGRTAPYTGTMGARVVELRKGYAQVELPDRRKVRNHLKSVHAVALLNVAEMTSGLGAMFSLDPNLRGIITHLEMDYLKKARGTITATCELPDLSSTERREEEFEVRLTNPDGELVARARAVWLLGA